MKISSRWYLFCLMLFLVPDPAQSVQEQRRIRYSEIATSRQLTYRVLNMTISTYYDVGFRITDLNHMRFMYERTPHYEQGYVFSELIERYKKMVDHYKRMSAHRSLHAYDAWNSVEHMQKLYMEIYHLVKMMHEIPRKYQSMGGEFMDFLQSAEEKERILAAKAAFAQAEKEREIAAKLAILAKKQAADNKVGGAGGVLLGLQSKQKYADKGPGGAAELGKLFPTRWPLIYGWEPVEWN